MSRKSLVCTSSRITYELWNVNSICWWCWNIATIGKVIEERFYLITGRISRFYLITGCISRFCSFCITSDGYTIWTKVCQKFIETTIYTILLYNIYVDRCKWYRFVTQPKTDISRKKTDITWLGLGLWCLMPLSTIFQYIVSTSFIGGGYMSIWRKPPTCRKSIK
jgi:hypothetical protein